MNTHADKTQENKSQSVANAVSHRQSSSESTFQFVDNRPEAVAQRKLQELANNSPRARQLKAIQEIANKSPQVKQAAQLQEMANNYSAQQQIPIQKKASPEPGRRENNTGLPDNLKLGIENLSGYSMNDVKVHYNSDKPTQLQAHAYAQGTDIHLSSGQEKHLPHETWHVVQQKQRRVKPTLQMKGNININDDVGLEKEADAMGKEALQNSIAIFQNTTQLEDKSLKNRDDSINADKLIQRKITVTKEGLSYKNTEEAFSALKSTFISIPEVDLRVILAKINTKDITYDDFENLKIRIQQLAEEPREQDLSESPDLWIKTGGLEDLRSKMNDQIDLWPKLSKDLVDYCTNNPKEVDKAGDILDCGKLTLPTNLNVTLGDFSQGLANVPNDLLKRLGEFLVGFMKANGQLPYIQSKEWFTSGSHKVVIEINFYPARGFNEDGTYLGVHKDTDSRNLFVNLIFNNPKKMPGTEWTMDELSPDDTRMGELNARLPEEEMINILAAKKSMENLPTNTPGRSNWEGGTVAPHAYVSWVDELIWHSTPVMKNRLKYNKQKVMGWLMKKDPDYEQLFYEAMLIVSENAHGQIKNHLNWFKKNLKDQSTWIMAADSFRNNPTQDLKDAYSEISDETRAVNWNDQKITGRAGRVEVDIGQGLTTDNRTVPTSAGGRPRSNSLNTVKIANQAALLEMRGGNPNADLPKRSFIRTWVMIVKV